MPQAPFPVDPVLTGIAIAYKNSVVNYIADQVAPYTPVEAESFEWDFWGVEEMYTIPETRVGRLSKPNQVTFTASNRTDSTQDYGLDAPVSQSDMDKGATRNYDPRTHATEGITELMLLDREVRVASQVFATASYDSTLRTTLSGSSQFSHPDSTPDDTISAALELPLMRPTHMVVSTEGWLRLARSPQLARRIRGNGTTEAKLTRQEVADHFELQGVIVGPGRVNSARRGQTANYTRIWGKHLALITINPFARVSGGTMPTSFITARFGNRVSGSIQDPDIGLEGGVRVRVGEKVKELNISTQCGYYFANAFA